LSKPAVNVEHTSGFGHLAICGGSASDQAKRGHDELRNFLRSRSRMCQHVPAATRRFHHMRRTAIALGILEAV